MAFVYNNKLPCYSWGGAANPASDGGMYLLSRGFAVSRNAYVRQVPLTEYGAVKYYAIDTNATLNDTKNQPQPVESTPCDAQMPWKKFVKTLYNSTDVQCFGLTLHGELYWITSRSSFFPSFARTISRVLHANVPYAFSNVCEATTGYTLSASGYTVYAIAVTKAGKAFEITVPSAANVAYPKLELIDLPAGVNAVSLWYAVTNAVLRGDDGNTYVRDNRTTREWYCLTTGLYKLDVPFAQAWNTALAEPTFSVDAPSAGTTATIKAIWGPPSTNQSGVTLRFATLVITNPGTGYTADMPVKRAGSGLATTGATARVFTDTIKDLAKDSAKDAYFISDSGKAWRFSPYVSDTEYGPSGAWAEQKLFTSSGVDVPIDAVSGNVVLGKDKKLYSGFVSGSRDLLDAGPWQSMASIRLPSTAGTGSIICAIDTSNKMFTWGGSTNFYGLYGDDSGHAVSRNTPTHIATSAEWLNVFGFAETTGYYFIAIRKDAICRSIDQPMEYWPDEYFA